MKIDVFCHVGLYFNDVNVAKALFPKGSVRLCYMIPLYRSLYCCRQLSSIRTIFRTSPGIFTYQILSFSIPDSIKKTMEVIEAIDYEGNFVQISLDVWGILGECPTSSQVFDVMEHTSGASSTHSLHGRQNIWSSRRRVYIWCLLWSMVLELPTI